MVHSAGMHGRVLLGELPGKVGESLATLPGEWLEFDPEAGAIVVRHVQPTEGPILATAVAELVRILDAVPYERQRRIPGGDLFVHTEEAGQLVRLRVEPGGALHVRWAHPDYARAARRPYHGGREIAIEPWTQRLNGEATLAAEDPGAAARDLQELADTYEGLYPEGDFRAEPDPAEGTVLVELRDVNLDARLLVKRLDAHARPRTLNGRIEVRSFDDDLPEQRLRFLFENGQVWVQHPLLWDTEPEV